MKKLRRWIMICVLGLAIVMPVLLTITSLNNTAFADGALTSGDMNAIRQNILYKSVYSNLQKCYNNMAGTIDESQESVWSNFSSTTYFKSEALENDFLKFPFDVGKRNESSCPKMITGWKNNWFIDLFKGEGSYSGLLKLNTGAVVPDPLNNTPAKMGEFLKNIGYTQKKDTTTMGDRKCFYLKFKINDAAYDYLTFPKPSGNNGYFETMDFCVKTDSNGNLSTASDAIIALSGNNEYLGDYDNGHLTDDSNMIWIYFENSSEGLAPQFRHLTYSDLKDKNYLQANISQIDFRYPYYSEFHSGITTWAGSVAPKNITKSNAEDEQECKKLGYYYCHTDDKGFLYSQL